MNVCRTCLSKDHLMLIFDDDIHKNKRTNDLFAVTGVKIHFNDGLPQMICVTCTNIINEALKLRKKSFDAEKQLMKNLNSKIKQEKNLKKTNVTISDLESSDSYNSAYSPLRIKDLESDNDCKRYVKRLTIDDLESSTSLNDTIANDISDIYKNVIPKFENVTEIDIEPSQLSPLHDIVDTDITKETKTERLYTIKDLESSDDDNDNLLDDKNFTYDYENKQKTTFLNTSHKQKEKKIALMEAENRKYMALAVQPYDNNGPVKCKLCNKILKNRMNFKCHAKTHFEPEFSCEICGKKFYGHSVLRYHQQRVHGKQKRLACKQCSYRAVDLQQLQNHTRAAHTGERPFVCDVCGDTFRMRNTITQHMRKHFGVRNVQCERCPAMFRSRSELSWHRNKVHLMVYTYFCYLCPQTYKNLGSVKKHLLKVHGVPLGQHLPIKSTKEMR